MFNGIDRVIGFYLQAFQPTGAAAQKNKKKHNFFMGGWFGRWGTAGIDGPLL